MVSDGWPFNQYMLYLLSAAWVAMGLSSASACQDPTLSQTARSGWGTEKKGLLEKKVGERGDELPRPISSKA